MIQESFTKSKKDNDKICNDDVPLNNCDSDDNHIKLD